MNYSVIQIFSYHYEMNSSYISFPPPKKKKEKKNHSHFDKGHCKNFMLNRYNVFFQGVWIKSEQSTLLSSHVCTI